MFFFFSGDSPEEKDVALKVLYNYYASSEGENGPNDAINSPDQWHLLHKQRNREVNLRPPGQHPNIVPVLGAFFDRAPPSGETDGMCWERIEEYPSGFAGRPLTWHFLMPRFVHSSNSHFGLSVLILRLFFLCEDSTALLKVF